MTGAEHVKGLRLEFIRVGRNELLRIPLTNFVTGSFGIV